MKLSRFSRVSALLFGLSLGVVYQIQGDCPSGVLVTPPLGFAGYGAQTVGGTVGDTVFVTTTDPTGAGSLHDVLEASSTSNKIVAFSVSGTFTTTSAIDPVGVHNITIDGATAPDSTPRFEGPSLSQVMFLLRGRTGNHDWIMKDIRFYNSGTDGFIRLEEGFYNFVGHGLSFHDCVDDEQFSTLPSGPNGEPDPDWRIYNVTLQYCFFNENPPILKGVNFISSRNMTIWRSIFYGVQRTPRVHTQDSGPVELIDCFIVDWPAHATYITDTGILDGIGNTYLPGPRTSTNAKGRAVYYGGVDTPAPGAVYLDNLTFLDGSSGAGATSVTPSGSGDVPTLGGMAAVNEVLAYAGARYRTAVDSLDRDATDSISVVEIEALLEAATP